MTRLALNLTACLLAAVAAFALAGAARPGPAAAVAAPEFPATGASAWVGLAPGEAPPTMASLRGRVVLLNVWTFGCVNCVRTLPWVQGIATRYADRGDLAIIGVHSPEFAHERDREAVAVERTRRGLTYPSYLDSDMRYWRALGNRYWPTVYLIDKAGRIRATQVGEVHDGDAAAASLERTIETLLAE
jgi:thiol-disulfide isomerase/thioredoxin